MFNFLINILESNIDYKTVLVLLFVYLGVLWLLFCFWVFLDANKRYHRMSLAIFFALIVLLFNFPALIFYFIIRPEREDENVLYVNHDHELAGVNVPVVNFIGKDGLELSLQIKINKTVENADMKVNVDWVKEDSESFSTKKVENVKVENAEVIADDSESKKIKSKVTSRARGVLSNVKNKGRSFLGEFKSYSKKLDKEDTGSEEVESEEKTEE